MSSPARPSARLTLHPLTGLPPQMEDPRRSGHSSGQLKYTQSHIFTFGGERLSFCCAMRCILTGLIGHS